MPVQQTTSPISNCHWFCGMLYTKQEYINIVIIKRSAPIIQKFPSRQNSTISVQVNSKHGHVQSHSKMPLFQNLNTIHTTSADQDGAS
jgi:hypothetical protein